MKEIHINTFAPRKPHAAQQQVLDALDKGQRFVMIRAGRKWAKTSLMISWLFEKAFETGLVCTYIAPSRKQAKDIVWTDHIQRMINELKRNKIPYKPNETELSITLPNGGKVQLHGVENKDALRGISNWGAVAMDEYDDWEEDIYPTIIRPNLITHSAPVIIAGTPKGFRNLYKIEKNPDFKCFHFRTHDNPDIKPEELKSIEREYTDMGMGYYRQEILAVYEKPYGIVYEEWPLENFVSCPYDPALPLYMSFDFGVNDPTAIIWVQRLGGEYHLIDYYEANDADIGHFSQVIKSKPYKTAELVCGDPAGKARSITTNTSPIEEYRKLGIYIRVKDGVKIPEQIRTTHKYIKSLYVDVMQERFRELILNYRYPKKSEALINQSNEIPVHDQYCLVGETKIRTLAGWKQIKDLVGKEFYVWGYSEAEKSLVPTKASKCWKTGENKAVVEVGLDDGESVRCTPEHRFMLRDGTYRAAKDLVRGDSLMPFYEWQTDKDKHTVINLNNGSSGAEHRIVFNRLKGHFIDEMVIHHKDNNKNNNNPENLEQISVDEHCRITKPHLGVSDISHSITGIRKYTKECVFCGKEFLGTWKSIYCSSKCSNRRRSFIRKHEERQEQPIKNCVWCGKEFHAYSKELTCSNECATERTKKYNKDYIANYKHVRKQNHKVMFVRDAGYDDVYDIETPETHNFVANGVVLHNSHGMRALEYLFVNLDVYTPPQISYKSIPKFEPGDSTIGI